MQKADAQRRTVGRTDLKLPVFGLGAAHFGGQRQHVDGDIARATMQMAWEGGVRYFDTAPWYGRGLSEHRVGDFLIDRPREDFVLTTKIGRVFRRPLRPAQMDMVMSEKRFGQSSIWNRSA
jgi:D-threo-aldose 1-dehydrogenase